VRKENGLFPIFRTNTPWTRNFIQLKLGMQQREKSLPFKRLNMLIIRMEMMEDWKNIEGLFLNQV
jgi:hypothetical protein